MNQQIMSVCHLKNWVKFPLIVCASLTCNISWALVEVSVSAGYAENPNFEVNSSVLSDESDSSLEATVWVNLDRESEFFDFDLDYTLLSKRYNDNINILGDRDDIAGNSTLTWKIVPEYFFWSLANNRSIEKIDFLLSDRPGNTEIINVTSTGPRIQIPVGLNNQVSMEGNYALADYEESSVGDQIRQSVTAQFLHNVNDRFNFSVNADYLDVEFDDEIRLGIGYKKSFLSAGTTFTKPTYNISLEVGEEKFERDIIGSENDIYLSFDAEYQPNTRSLFSLSYSESIEDRFSMLLEANRSVAGILNLTPGQGFNGSTGGADALTIFRLKETIISYIYTTQNLSSLSLYYNNDSRESKSTNELEEVEALTLEYTYAANLNLRVSMYGTIEQRFFSEEDRKQDEYTYGLIALYQANTQLGFQFRLESIKRSGNYIQDNYLGWEAKFGIVYRLQP